MTAGGIPGDKREYRTENEGDCEAMSKPQFLNEKQVSETIAITVRTLQRWRLESQGPSAMRSWILIIGWRLDLLAASNRGQGRRPGGDMRPMEHPDHGTPADQPPVPGLTAREIAGGTGLALSTTYRALRGLEARSLIIREPGTAGGRPRGRQPVTPAGGRAQ